MIKIHIFSIGKTKEDWLERAIEEYQKRLSGSITIDFLLFKDNSHLLSAVQKENLTIALDPKGIEMSSEKFTSFFYHKVEESGSRLSFVIGGPEGLPQEIRSSCPLISLSQMTFTHQIARLILAEQIYRAYTIEHGIPYHK